MLQVLNNFMKCFERRHLTWVLLGNYLLIMVALVKENRRSREFLSFMCFLSFPLPITPCPAGETEAHLNYVQLDNIRIRCWV